MMPLFVAAGHGHAPVVRELLRAKANPLLGRTIQTGESCIPLDVAAHRGYSEVVREMIQQVGINCMLRRR